jgi:KRAB domain-containing zinc finger protein
MTFKKQKPFDQHKCLSCTHCPKIFSSKTKLNDHIRNIHTDESLLNLFICDICGKSFKYRPSIVRHVLDHREEAKYKCEVCGKKWKSDIALKDHIRMCHAAELITCKICFKQMKPQCIYQHMKYVHTSVRDFKCKICDADFKTKEKLKRHLDTHNRKFNCDQCTRKFSSQYELTEHLKWHEDPEVFKCSICKKSFSTRTSLTTHTKLHKGIVRNLQCPHCPFTTHRKESIKYHLTTHEKRDKKLEMKKNWLKCEKCGALLKNKASLWGHHRKVHPTERFTCDYCGIVVKTKHSLKHHIEVKHVG